MLPSLKRLWNINEGSSRESDEAYPLRGFSPVTKFVIISCLRCSSTMACSFRLRTKKNVPPTIAVRSTTPTTTPAAIAAVLGPLSAACGVGVGVTIGAADACCVTTTVAGPVVEEVEVEAAAGGDQVYVGAGMVIF